MKTLIAYATKYGGTKACAERIAQRLDGQADLLELTPQSGAKTDLSPYGAVVVGCSVYMGRPRKEAMAFCERNMDSLLTKKVGLFLCCIQDLDKTVAQQFTLAFPKRLRDSAAVLGALGGVVNYKKLKGLDGFIMKLVAGDLRKKTGSDVVSTLSDERIDRFVSLLIQGAKAG